MSNTSKGRSGGVLPVNAAARKTPTPAKSSNRAPAPKSRLIIRRLPPGLTESEFWLTLGPAWKVGGGKIDWAAFKEGKVSKDPAKPSRPARAYLRVKEQSFLEELSTVVKQSSFLDAKNTSKDPCLLGPPSLEFAPYNKTPSGRVRNDGRQGTIDQDQEFIDFLQSLTEPIIKGAVNGTDPTDSKVEKVSTTPLIQYIKEKKANKAKEASQAKAAKTREAKEAKPAKPETRSTVIIKGKNAPVADKERIAKATQDAVKAVNKSVAIAQGGKQAAGKAETKQATKEPTPQAAPAPKRERERGNASAAARMLQRDLGLLAKESKAQRAVKTVSTNANTSESVTSPKAVAPTKSNVEPTTEKKEKNKETAPPTPTTQTPPTGPKAARAASAASTASSAKAQSSTSTQRPAKAAPQPTSGAKSAFLKHANPSQGITEEALQAAFKDFGTITKCEIDKKKGLGYVDFDEPEALRKAMAASPVKVANGQVTVLENKNSQGGGKRGGMQQKQKGEASKNTTNVDTKPGATSAPTNPKTSTSAKVADAQPATATASSTPSEATPTVGTAPVAAAPPSAPRANPRGGGRNGRGGGSAKGQSRGSGQGGRGGNRGGKGGQGRKGGQGGVDGTPNSEPTANQAVTAVPSASSATIESKKE